MKALQDVLSKANEGGRLSQELNKNEIIDALEIIGQNILDKKTSMLDANTLFAIRHQFMSPGQRIFDYNKNASELTLAEHLSKAGSVKTEIKSNAARENGKKGGRPKTKKGSNGQK